MAEIGGLNLYANQQEDVLQTPQEEVIQPTKTVSSEQNLLDKSIDDYQKQSLLLNKQIQKMIDSYGERTSSINPRLAALSEGLGSDTPFFGTAFSRGIAGMAKADADERKQSLENAKMRLELMKAGQEMSQKEIISQLAPKLFKVDSEGKFTGEIDNAIAQKMVALTGDVNIIQKVIDMSKPKIGHMPAGSVTYDERSGKIIATTPKEYTPSDLKKKEDELAQMKKDLEKDPTNETLKNNIKYHEDELKKVEQMELPDEVLTAMAIQALKGDTSVFLNIGRGAQASNNLVKLRTRMTEIMKARGMNPEDIAAANAEFFGIKAGERAVGTRGANVQLAAQGFLNTVPLATNASEKVYRSKLLPAGKIEVFFDEQTNDPDLSKFAAYNNALVNTYARAISPTGIPTVRDKEHARKIISEAKNHEAYMSAVNALQNEIEAEKRAPKEVRESMRSEITGKYPTTNKPSAQPASGKHYLNNREIVVKGGKWVYADTGEEAK